MVGTLIMACGCTMTWCDLFVIFDLGSARIFSADIFETYFSYDKDILITLTDYCMYFYYLPPGFSPGGRL